ncbi:MAG: DUF2249 domain-containing protein [Bacteroidota bacterium]
MNISSATRISAVLKANPAALDAIVSLNPAFEKLRNPILRKLLAARVTIAEAAKIGDVKLPDFLKELEEIGFTIEGEVAEESFKNEVFKNDFSKPKITLDANEFLKNGEDPLRAIQKAVSLLGEGETALVTANFKPAPLARLMHENGHKAEIHEINGVWHTYITRQNKDFFKSMPKCSTDFKQMLELFKNRIVEIDVRLLPMPEPMIKILENAEILPDSHALFIHHKRVPEHLLPELQNRGFGWSIEQLETDVNMLVWRK